MKKGTLFYQGYHLDSNLQNIIPYLDGPYVVLKTVLENETKYRRNLKSYGFKFIQLYDRDEKFVSFLIPFEACSNYLNEKQFFIKCHNIENTVNVKENDVNLANYMGYVVPVSFISAMRLYAEGFIY